MRQADIVIVGGGLTGSVTAAMLGRAGYDVALIDPHRIYPPDFRCEKLGGQQLETIRKTGVYEAIRKASTLDGHAWTARYGRLLDEKPSDQHGIFYDTLVNTVRGEIPENVARIEAKSSSISTSDDRQSVTLSNGETISARLVVLANGLNNGLRHKLGIERTVIGPCYSITIGFNITPVGQSKFPFPALTYFAENVSAQMAYLTLFPIGNVMRANLMVYRDLHDPWLQRMRHAPEAALQEMMPKLHRLTGGFAVDGRVHIRPADLYVTSGHRQAGIVVIGDAFSTSCPAAGTGRSKAFTDVERLCNVHVPAWLATPGMGADKIAQFYDDPEKQRSDERSANHAVELRASSINPSLIWTAHRLIHFGGRLAIGTARSFRGKIRPVAAVAQSA